MLHPFYFGIVSNRVRLLIRNMEDKILRRPHSYYSVFLEFQKVGMGGSYISFMIPGYFTDPYVRELLASYL